MKASSFGNDCRKQAFLPVEIITDYTMQEYDISNIDMISMLRIVFGGGLYSSQEGESNGQDRINDYSEASVSSKYCSYLHVVMNFTSSDM